MASTSGAPVPGRELLEAYRTFGNVGILTLFEEEKDADFPLLAVIAPIRRAIEGDNPQSVSSAIVGAVILITRRDTLKPLFLTDVATTATGETLFVSQRGKEVVFISPFRNRAQKETRLRTSRNPANAELLALEGREAFAGYTDYRGKDVVAVTRYIPEIGWGMVTKIDRQEVLARFRQTVVQALCILFVSLGALISLSVALWRYQQIHLLRAEIARRTATEEKLQQSEHRFFTAFRFSPEGMSISTLKEGRYIEANEVFLRMLGYQREEVVGKTSTELGIWARPEDRTSLIQKYQRGETVRDIELNARTKSGQLRRVLLSLETIQLQDELCLLASLRDITERREVEEQLRLHAAALESAANAIVITDRRGVILWINAAFTKLTGYSGGEAIGQNPRILKSGEHPQSFYKDMWSKLLSGQIWRGGIINRKKDGQLYSEEMTITPVRDAQGEIAHFIAIKQDVTEQKELERQLYQAQKMEAVGQLAGGIAHDFNNLLGVILGYSEILEEQFASSDPNRKKVEQVHKAAVRAALLTRQLLAFSRRQVLQPVVMDLNATVVDVDKMLSRLISEDIKLVTVLQPHLGKVKADRTQIEQIIMNLAVNARDAMPQGGTLTIETSNVDLDESYARQHPVGKPGPYVRLTVSDTGIGIDKEIQAHIFEPFFTTKGVGKGTGLGLSTVYGIVKQSGGYIWVYSEPGQGTIFKVYLPRVEEAVEQPKEERPTLMPTGTETILLVEDAASFLELTREFLESCGYTVLAAGSSAEGIRIFEKHEGPIPLLITDIVMPEMSGRALAEKLTAMRPSMRVLYMSGYSHETIDRYGAMDFGQDYLQKPFTKKDLATKVRELLDAPTP
ncbi:MAG: PAS domain S-box protein [Candidatus Acidiferrum sp.]